MVDDGEEDGEIKSPSKRQLRPSDIVQVSTILDSVENGTYVPSSLQRNVRSKITHDSESSNQTGTRQDVPPHTIETNEHASVEPNLALQQSTNNIEALPWQMTGHPLVQSSTNESNNSSHSLHATDSNGSNYSDRADGGVALGLANTSNTSISSGVSLDFDRLARFGARKPNRIVHDNKFHVLLAVSASIFTHSTFCIIETLRDIYGPKQMVIQIVVTALAARVLRLDKLPSDIKVWTDDDEKAMWLSPTHPIPHEYLRDWAHVLVVAPANLDMLRRTSARLYGDLVSNVIQSWHPHRPLLLAPAMPLHAHTQPTTQGYLTKIKKEMKWIEVMQPPPVQVAGSLRELGEGAMVNWVEIVERLAAIQEDLFPKIETFQGTDNGEIDDTDVFYMDTKYEKAILDDDEEDYQMTAIPARDLTRLIRKVSRMPPV